jgi:hypothetical protein
MEPAPNVFGLFCHKESGDMCLRNTASYTKMFSLQCRGPAEGLDKLLIGVMLSLTFITDDITVSKAKCHLFYPPNCRKLYSLLLKLEQ